MTLAKRQDGLQRLYALYDRELAGWDLACHRGCSACCSAHVTVTTLEASLLLPAVESAARPALPPHRADPRRLRPRLTVNTLADHLRRGRTPPQEPEPAPGTRCAWLAPDGTCPVYPQRPFACRCMVSVRRCNGDTWAEMDPYLLTVNEVFLQVIEHLDGGGWSGNLTDMLACLQAPGSLERYDQGRLGGRAHGLVANRPMTVLMVPPEHRARIQGLLGGLQAIIAGVGATA